MLIRIVYYSINTLRYWVKLVEHFKISCNQVVLNTRRSANQKKRDVVKKMETSLMT